MKTQEIELFFQTVNTPPPFSYKYDLLLRPGKNSIYAELTLNYTDRETITEEEITDEGFTMEDDYSWKGDISGAWLPYLEELTVRLEKGSKTFQDNYNLRAILKNEDGKTVHYFHSLESLEYILNEMLQALFETSGKERPLEIKFLEISDKSEQYILKAEFKERTASVSANGEKKKEVRWDELRRILSLLYAPEYQAQYAVDNFPKEKGLYIDPGDGLWYKSGKAIVEPGKKSKALEKISDIYMQLKAKMI
jgi:hypothetical protein